MRVFRPLSVLAILSVVLTALGMQNEALTGQISVCGLVPGLPCATGGSAGAVGYAQSVLIPGLMSVFVAIAMGFLFYYAVRLMLESEDESTIAETKSAYAYAISGVAVVSLAQLIVAGTGIGTSNVVDAGPVNTAIGLVIDYLLAMTSAAVTAMMVFQAFRIILLQGQESEIEQQKKRFFNGLIGVAVILIAGPLVNSFLPGSNSNILSGEVVGIVNFLLTLFGALCVLGIIVAGILMVVSTDEALKDRAKKAIFGTVVSLIVVLCSYLIVSFVASL